MIIAKNQTGHDRGDLEAAPRAKGIALGSRIVFTLFFFSKSKYTSFRTLQLSDGNVKITHDGS
jgi:hypothetical protein